MPTSTPMIAITTSNSTSVNARRLAEECMTTPSGNGGTRTREAPALHAATPEKTWDEAADRLV
jgi:hypothetical protein